MHWAAGYIGTPWVAGQSDCWSFARRVWRERFGWTVPPIPADPSSPLAGRRAFGDAGNYRGWSRVDDPREGDAVLMAMGAHPCHVGVHVAPGRVLHSVERSGVICTPLGRVADLGYRVTGFWRHAG